MEIVNFSNFLNENISVEEISFAGVVGRLSIGRDDNGDYYVNFLPKTWKELDKMRVNREKVIIEIGGFLQRRFHFEKKPFLDIDNPAAGYSFKLYDYEVRALLINLLK